MLRASIEYRDKGFFGNDYDCIVTGPSGSKTFYGKESRDEAWNYYQSEKRLEDEIALRQKQSDLADMQMREIKERERRAQKEQYRQKNAPQQFGIGRISQRPSIHYDPEYAEFLKWKKENDPEYQKFKREKARKEAEANEEAQRAAQKAKEEVQRRQELKILIEKGEAQEDKKQIINEEGITLFRSKEYEDAIIYFNQLLKFNPNDYNKY